MAVESPPDEEVTAVQEVREEQDTQRGGSPPVRSPRGEAITEHRFI